MYQRSPTQYLTRMLLAAALALVLSAAACGGGGGVSEEKTPAAEQRTLGPGGGGWPGDARGELEQFVKRWQGREAKVVYDFTAKSASGDGSQGTVVLYWKFPDWRADFQAEGETVSLLQQGDGFFVCPEEKRTCYKLPLQMPGLLSLPFFFVVGPSERAGGRIQEWIERQTGADTRRSSRRIAGEEGVCYAMADSGPEGRGQREFCWSQDGILLLVSVDTSDQQGNRSTFTLEAKAIERSVSPGDITPPYRVQEFPPFFAVPGHVPFTSWWWACW